ncbi:Cysteine-rich receptor protein kinase 25 [Spatholobus suberectus]|nr:Cysteine-rich receptor protein kinase 25 [Spatholobus suberectus]
MAFYHILYLFILVSCLSLAITEAQDDDSSYIYQDCSGEKTDAGTSFYSNLQTLLSALPLNATGDSQFCNTTITGKNPSDSVYAVFMCRGDLPPWLCQQCVQSATQQLHSDCSLSKQAVIWYFECMVRYSHRSLSSTVVTTPKYHMANTTRVFHPEPESFMRLLFLTMNQTADEASHHHKKYATRQTSVLQSQTLYSLAQCTPDLSPRDCRTCLSEAIGELSSCCKGRIGGRVLYPSCNIRYELYPFYYFSMAPSLALVPGKNASDEDSIFSNDLYLSHNCSTDDETFPVVANSPSQIHLATLLSYLSSIATSKSFHMTSVAKSVHGLFLCQPDLPSQLCGQCVQNATHRISSECHSLEATIWYSRCMVRYSSQNFFSTVSTSPVFSLLNITSTIQEQNSFIPVLANTLDEAVFMAGGSDERYGTKSSKLNDLQIIYTLAQCTHDLSSDDCRTCLGYILGTEIQWTHLGSVGGRVQYPSCNLRFELFKFYGNGDDEATPRPTAGDGTRGIKSNFPVKTILIVAIILVLVVGSRYMARGNAHAPPPPPHKKTFCLLRRSKMPNQRNCRVV